jgi:hypothetical protein
MEKSELREIICDVLQIPKLNGMLEAQINRFVVELGLSYRDIAQALVFYIEVEKNVYDPKYGMGIVPHIKDRANAYFAQKRKEKQKQLDSVKEANKQTDIILKVNKISRRKEKPKIDIENLDVD